MSNALSPTPCSAPTPSRLLQAPQTTARAPAGQSRPPPRAARRAVATLFFLNGSLFATWVARIPTLQTQQGFNHGQLGLALLAMALGAVIAMPLAGRFAARRGSETVCKIAALLFCALLPLLAAAPNPTVFVASLLLFGAAHGALDVAMNAHAVAVEAHYRRPIMSSFHALFSTGGLFGAAAGAAIAALGLTPFAHFALFAVLFAGAGLAVFPQLLKTAGKPPASPTSEASRRIAGTPPSDVRRPLPRNRVPEFGGPFAEVSALEGGRLFPDNLAFDSHGPVSGALASEAGRNLTGAPSPRATARPTEPRPRKLKDRLQPSALAALGIVAACIMMGEGAIADWAAVYLRDVRLSSESVAATGYAAFSIAMALGRFFGDGLTARLGPVRLVRLGGLTAAAGLVIALLLPGAPATLAGLALVGVGFSGIVPIVFSAAGRSPGIDPGVALATVTTTGYVGFLIGPPLIGLAAEWLGLPLALGLVVATSLLSVALAPAVRPRLTDHPLAAE